MRLTNEIDNQLGLKLRQARLAANLTQLRLAKKIGISFQQLQKYENATNRISSSRLVRFADALELPISYFFDGLQQSNAEVLPDRIIRVARVLHEMPDGAVKDQILQLIKAVSADERTQ